MDQQDQAPIEGQSCSRALDKAGPQQGQPGLADLIFPDNSNNHKLSKVLGDLRRLTFSITNRLHSIIADADFVKGISRTYAPRPLVANERCGSWYVDPADKAASAYYKSTDGHTGQWKFSTRRLNLHLLEVIGRHDGCVLVDSTRRGKSMPDALSKTVPIWCCILNRALFPTDTASHDVHVPADVVSPSELSQIQARIPGFVDSFASLRLDLTRYRSQLNKPLRPIWVTPTTAVLPNEADWRGFHPVICCTSSRRVPAAEVSAGGYIQGAADDTENWAHGLTVRLFWEHRNTLLCTPESDLPSVIASLVGQVARPNWEDKVTQLASCVWVRSLLLRPAIVSGESEGEENTRGTVPPPPPPCLISLLPDVTPVEMWIKSPFHMDLGLGRHKLASRNLRGALPHIRNFVGQYLAAAALSPLAAAAETGPCIIIACETGNDLSVAVALMLWCWYLDENGNMRTTLHSSQPRPSSSFTFTKDIIRQRLSRIMIAFPEANPSRSALQSVNSFLMS